MLINQLKNFNDNGVFYCLWKNIHNYHSQIEDPFDLDLYIDPKDSARALEILEQNGWIKVVSPVSDYKYIKHYFYFTYNKTYHLHLYLGLRTGDSWLKNYYLPIEYFIKKNSFKDKNNVFLLSKSAYYIIFLFRLIIKNSSSIGRFLYRKNLSKYNFETSYIDTNLSNIKSKELLEREFKSFINLIEEGKISHKEIPNLKESINLSRIFKRYLLIDNRTIFLRQAFSFFIRLVNKLFSDSISSF